MEKEKEERERKKMERQVRRAFVDMMQEVSRSIMYVCMYVCYVTGACNERLAWLTVGRV